MHEIIEAVYEKGVIKPLKKLKLKEGEKIRIIILPKEFPELVSELEIEAKEPVDEVLRRSRQRWKEWY